MCKEEGANMKDRLELQNDIENALKRLRKEVSSDDPRYLVCKRFMETYSTEDAWKMIYYLTDEDYINERHALMFFATKLYETT
jgi:hypothetical protein